MTAWDDDVAAYVTGAVPSREYSIDSSETTGSITVTAYDNVGHYDLTSYTVSMINDVTDPSCTITVLSEASDFLHTSGTTIIWYGIARLLKCC